MTRDSEKWIPDPEKPEKKPNKDRLDESITPKKFDLFPEKLQGPDSWPDPPAYSEDEESKD